MPYVGRSHDCHCCGLNANGRHYVGNSNRTMSTGYCKIFSHQLNPSKRIVSTFHPKTGTIAQIHNGILDIDRYGPDNGFLRIGIVLYVRRQSHHADTGISKGAKPIITNSRSHHKIFQGLFFIIRRWH